MAEIGSVFVRIGAEMSGLVKGLNLSQAKMQEFGKKMQQAGESLTYRLSLPLIAMGGAALKASADMEEMSSKFNAVFKEQAGEVEAWAKQQADATGRSRFRWMEYASTLQDTFVPLGFARKAAAELSKQVVQLAGDLGSFNNVPTAEVVRDLQSALVGNVETLRKYGIVATEAAIKQEVLATTGREVKGVLDAQTKASAILSIALKSTTDAQGDLIRTKDSLTNKTATLNDKIYDLRVEMGNELKPIAEDLLGKIGNLVKAFSEMDAATKQLTVQLGLFAIALGPLLKLGGIIMALSVPLKIVTAAVVAFVAAGIGISKVADELDKIGVSGDNLLRTLAPSMFAWKEYFGTIKVDSAAAKVETDKLTAALREQLSVKNIVAKHGGVTPTPTGQPTTPPPTVTPIDAEAAKKALKAKLKGLEEDIEFQLRIDTELADMHLDRFQRDLERDKIIAGIHIELATPQIEDELEKLTALSDDWMSGFEEGIGDAARGAAEQIEKVRTKIGEVAMSVGGVTIKWGELEEAAKRMWGSTSELAQAFTGVMIQTFDRIGDSIGFAFANIVTGVENAKSAFQRLRDELRNVVRDLIAMLIKVAAIAALVSLVTGVPFKTTFKAGLKAQAGIPQLAEGGIVTRPTIAMIGERGPEAVIPLSRMGQQQPVQPVLRVGMGELWVELDRYGRENGLTMS